MGRTLSEIKNELSARFISEEYLPLFITRTVDLQDFANSVGEFLAPYVKQIEDLENIWTDKKLLREFLTIRGMYFAGDEDLAKLQLIATNRYKIMLDRGTMNMIAEVRRLVNDRGVLTSQTTIEYKGFGQVGWIVERTSPMYRSSAIALNLCYISAKDMVVFNIRNQSSHSDAEIEEILRKYFEPKHIRCLYNFI